VLAPGVFWDQTLKPKLQQLLGKKTPRNKCYEPDETNVVVSVTDRSQRDRLEGPSLGSITLTRCKYVQYNLTSIERIKVDTQFP